MLVAHTTDVTRFCVNAPVNKLLLTPPRNNSEPDVASLNANSDTVVFPCATNVWKTGFAPNSDIWGKAMPMRPSGGNSALAKPVE